MNAEARTGIHRKTRGLQTFAKRSRSWRTASLAPALIAVVPALVVGVAVLISLVSAGCAASRQAAAQRSLPAAAPSAPQRDHVLRTVAAFKHLGFQVVAARLRLGVDTALAWRQLDTLLAKPTGDIFWMYPATGFYLNVKDRLDAAWRARFRNAWKTYTPYRGDTENHFLMYYASLLLMCQEWPGLAGSEWFNGKSSEENYREAHEYLEHWIDETVRFGSTEWDSPRYAYYYITPLVLLRDFTADEPLRRRCEMLLELTLADYAVEYLDGSYCGAHSRDGDGSVIDPRRAEVTSYGQLYFSDSIAFVLPDLAYAAMSPWRCPPIIRAMAHDRDRSYVHTELKRSRAKIRFAPARYTSVRKYDFMTPDYCLGSIQGGLHQPIQQHSWDVTFASPKANNTLFALHPTWSARELGMFFPEDPQLMVEGVARAKASYTNENKWIGGSFGERVHQREGTLVAEYPIAADDPVRHVDLFLPMTADTIVADESGWWFLRFGGALVAVTTVGGSDTSYLEGAWRRVRARALDAGAGTDSARIAVVVTCARMSETDMASFIRNVRRTDRARLVPNAGGEYTLVDGAGRSVTLNPSEAPRLSKAIDDAQFAGPNITQARGIPVVELKFGGTHRILDFARGSSSE